MKNNGLKNAKAITLIAMVVTIIVLLILAGVSIAVLTGENGLLNRATTAKQTHEEKTEEEKLKLGVLALSTEYRSQTTHTYLKFSGFVDSKKAELEAEMGATAETPVVVDTDEDTLTYRGKTYTLDSLGGITDYIEVKTVTIKIGGENKKIKETDDMSKYYGTVVTNYTAGPSGETTTWRIFYIDFAGKYGPEGTIYLKADYNNSRTMGLSSYTSYIPSDISATSVLAKINPDWYANGGAESAIWLPKEHCVSYLCDPTNWSNYVNGDANYAIGSPSAEMYCDSYNSVSHTGENVFGNYTLGASCIADSYHGYIYTLDGVQATDYYTENDTLDYTQYGSMYAGSNGSKTGSWFLASPCARDSAICSVYGDNSCLNYAVFYQSAKGLCPLVSLKSTFIPQISATN